MDNLKSAIEAVLFAAGDSVPDGANLYAQGGLQAFAGAASAIFRI